MLQLQGRNYQGQRNNFVFHREPHHGFFEKVGGGRKHGRKLPEQEKKFILRNNGNQCAVTGTFNTGTKPLGFHHIVPPEYGGTYAPSNFCPITPQAHRRVHQVIKAMLRGGAEPTKETFESALQYVQKEYWAAVLAFWTMHPLPEPRMHKKSIETPEHIVTEEEKLAVAVLFTVGLYAREKLFRRFLRALRRNLYRQHMAEKHKKAA